MLPALLVCGLLLAGGTADEAHREGLAKLRAKDHAAAAAAFERALRLDPEHTRAWLDLGIARAALRDWPAAIEAYERLLAIDPRQPKALHNLGNVYLRQGQYETAAEYYAKALELDPDYLRAAYHLGHVLKELNRPEQAEQQLRRCMEIGDPRGQARQTHLDCAFDLGTLRFRAEDYAATATIMERVLATFPTHPEARYYLGMAYQRLGRREEAREQLEIHRQLLRALRDKPPIEKRPEP